MDMHKGILRFAAVCILLFVGAVWADSRYRLSWIFVDWTSTEAVPFKVREKVEIASRWYPLKRSSVSLLCGRDGVHLMLKSRLAMPSFMREDVRPFTTYSSSTEIVFDWTQVPGGVRGRSFRTRSAVVAFGSVDTVMTATLTAADKEMVIDWFRRGAPENMNFYVLETGANDLTGVVDAKVVSAFIRRCAAP